MMILVANDLSIAMIATRIAKMMYIFFFRPDERLLMSSAEIKLIAVYDSDPDFIEYVYFLMCTSTKKLTLSTRRFYFMIAILILLSTNAAP